MGYLVGVVVTFVMARLNQKLTRDDWTGGDAVISAAMTALLWPASVPLTLSFWAVIAFSGGLEWLVRRGLK